MSNHRLFVLIAVGCSVAVLSTGCPPRHPKPQGDETLKTVGFDDETEGDGDTFRLTKPGPLGAEITDVKFDNVLFDYDSAKINTSEYPRMEAVAAFLKKGGARRVILGGHCDERGTSEYNMTLGERRALAVRAHLIGLGADAAVLFTQSYSKEKPINPGHTEEAWRVNRRVEFSLYR